MGFFLYEEAGDSEHIHVINYSVQEREKSSFTRDIHLPN
jgi:hypothetical protein